MKCDFDFYNNTSKGSSKENILICAIVKNSDVLIENKIVTSIYFKLKECIISTCQLFKWFFHWFYNCATCKEFGVFGENLYCHEILVRIKDLFVQKNL